MLTPSQRAVLLLRDVLAFRAAEVATVLGTSADAVNSTLRRARARLAEAPPDEERLAEPEDAVTRVVLDRYVRAFEQADVDGLVRLFHEEVRFEMPPQPTWFRGRGPTVDFLAGTVLPLGWRLEPVAVKGGPGVLLRESDGGSFHGVQVLGVEGGRVIRVTSFNDAGLERVFDPGERPR